MAKNAKLFLTGIFIALCWVMMVGGLAVAQEKFPSKQITIIVANAPGGGQDVAARALQPFLEKFSGVSFVVENKAGGGGTIGMGAVMRSAPDGYTLGYISPSISTVKYTIKDTTVDYVKFEPIIFATYSPQIIVVKKEARWNTLKEFLDEVKANPEKIKLGNTGHGGLHHVSALYIERVAKVKFINTPYQGTAAGIPDLLGGHVDAFITAIPDVFHLIDGGALKAIGVADTARNKFLPGAQTFVELGINHKILSYHACVGPKGIPVERVKFLYDLFLKALNTNEVKTFYEKQGATLSVKDPVEFGKFLGEEDKMWGEMITNAGIKPQ
jgi:tripartite-type tricarboxylate transporter receptor subunit TctC